MRFDDEGEDGYSDNALSDSLVLTDERTVLRGFVTLSSNDNEQAIRKALSDTIQMKYPAVASEDLVFLKANRRRLTKPLNCHEYSYKQVKSLAGQGAINVKLKNCLSFLLNSQSSDSSSLNDEEFRNHALTRPTSTLSEAQGPLVDSNHTQSRPVSNQPLTEGQEVDNSDGLSTVTGLGNENLNAVTAEKLFNLETAMAECISICKENNVCNPVEVLKCAQKLILQGCPFDVLSTEEALDGETNFVCIDRFNVFSSAAEEFHYIQNLRLTLEVSYYGEKAQDAGGPRKEFFRLCLKEIQE